MPGTFIVELQKLFEAKKSFTKTRQRGSILYEDDLLNTLRTAAPLDQESAPDLDKLIRVFDNCPMTIPHLDKLVDLYGEFCTETKEDQASKKNQYLFLRLYHLAQYELLDSQGNLKKELVDLFSKNAEFKQYYERSKADITKYILSAFIFRSQSLISKEFEKRNSDFITSKTETFLSKENQFQKLLEYNQKHEVEFPQYKLLEDYILKGKKIENYADVKVQRPSIFKSFFKREKKILQDEKKSNDIFKVIGDQFPHLSEILYEKHKNATDPLVRIRLMQVLKQMGRRDLEKRAANEPLPPPPLRPSTTEMPKS